MIANAKLKIGKKWDLIAIQKLRRRVGRSSLSVGSQTLTAISEGNKGDLIFRILTIMSVKNRGSQCAQNSMGDRS